jgi:hypothetical protein
VSAGDDVPPVGAQALAGVSSGAGRSLVTAGVTGSPGVNRA